MSVTFKAIAAALVVIAAWVYYFLAPPGAPLRRADPAVALSPIAAKKLEIFDLARKRSADLSLVALYGDINTRYFQGELPAIPVMWDEGLGDVDALVGDNYHLQGMTNGSLMLLSPALRDHEAELQRTVCHEAVHVKLHRASGTAANHGDAFQAELRRIFEEGCFTAILAAPEEQAALKRWIDDETARLTAEKEGIDAERERIDAERADLERAITDMNARIAAANTQRSGWPTDDEQQALSARRERAIQASSDFNETLARHNADADHLNREIERYTLMAAYPRGMDEEMVTRKQ